MSEHPTLPPDMIAEIVKPVEEWPGGWAQKYAAMQVRAERALVECERLAQAAQFHIQSGGLGRGELGGVVCTILGHTLDEDDWCRRERQRAAIKEMVEMENKRWEENND